MELLTIAKATIFIGLIAISGFSGYTLGHNGAESTAKSQIAELKDKNNTLSQKISTSEKQYQTAVDSYNELYDAVLKASTYRPPVNTSLYCSSTSYGMNYQYSSTYCY